jgi:putative ABC transport system ATP-binding protein
MIILEAIDIYRFYHTGDEETLALRGVSIQVSKGETVAVMGPSGSGKSTLMACLSGLDVPDGGHVELMGKRISRLPETDRSAIRAAEMGILLQSGNLFPHLTVEENIRLQMRLTRKNDTQRLMQLLKQVGLSHRSSAYPSQLSGGEAARAGLAVALAVAPPILLADEPTGEVDVETEQHLLQLLDELRNHGSAILVVTHSEELAKHANRIIRLNDGRVVYD